MGRALLRALRWRIEGEIPNVAKFVLIVVPHTSNWDFVIGIVAKWALGIRVMFLGKNTLFRFPFGAAMRALGGVPVDRSASHDVVRDIVAEFARRERMILALAPEGTRKHVERWRTGFYHIARGAGVPILSVALNYGVRAIQIGPLFTTTGDMERDVTELQQEFANVNDRKPTA